MDWGAFVSAPGAWSLRMGYHLLSVGAVFRGARLRVALARCVSEQILGLAIVITIDWTSHIIIYCILRAHRLFFYVLVPSFFFLGLPRITCALVFYRVILGCDRAIYYNVKESIHKPKLDATGSALVLSLARFVGMSLKL